MILRAGPWAGFSEGSFSPADPMFPFLSLFSLPFSPLSPTEQREQMRARGPSHPLRHMEVISSVSVITQELLCNGSGFYCTETNLFLHKTSLWLLLQGLLGQVLAGIKACGTPSSRQEPRGPPAGQSTGGRGRKAVGRWQPEPPVKTSSSWKAAENTKYP